MGVEGADRGIEQRLGVETFLVRSWVSIRRPVWLAAWAFWRLSVWGEASFDRFRGALMNHPWRLRKAVNCRFDGIATLLRERLHPHPRLSADAGRTPVV